MKPPNRLFERAIRNLAHRELRRSKPIWKEYKRSRHSWLRLRPIDSRVFLIFVLVWIIGALANTPPGHVGLALALYGLGTVCMRASLLSSRLYHPDANRFYVNHPIPDPVIFKKQIETIIPSLLWTFAIFVTGLALMFRARLEIASTWTMIAAIALGMCLACLGGVLAMLRFLPRITAYMGLAAIILYVAALVASSVPQNMIEPIQRILMFTPVGSIAYFITQSQLQGNTPLLALVPSFVYISLAPLLFGQLQRSYRTTPQFEELFGASEDLPSGELASVIAERRVLETLNVTPRSQRPWLDRFIHRQFSRRDEIVCRFLAGHETNWTLHWIRGSKVALVSVALLAAGIPEWMSWWPGTLAIMLAIPLFGGEWMGLTDVVTSGKKSPFFAAFPVGFLETARVLLKVNIIRTLAWSPGVMVVFLSIGTFHSVPAAVSARYSLEFLFGVLCLQPIAIVGKFSKGSNDTKVWGRAAFVLPTFVVCGLAFALSWFGLAFAAAALAKLAFALGMALSSTLMLVLYRFGYERCYWDLLHEP